MEKIIKVENLTKSFGKKVILENINISFFKGDNTAIIGHNGSGKSTFIRILGGLCSISQGKVIKDKKLRFNYIPENYTKSNLTINEYLKCMADIEKIDYKDFKNKLVYFYDRFNLMSLKDVPLKNLSKGSLQKAAILQALIGNADVLLLDEPMTGLDVDSQNVFIEEVKKMTDKGTTIIMSCHESFLIDSLCSRILEIKDKKLVETKRNKQELNNILTFELTDNMEFREIIEDYGRFSINNNVLRLEVEKSKSNKVLFEMLKKGYILRRFEEGALDYEGFTKV